MNGVVRGSSLAVLAIALGCSQPTRREQSLLVFAAASTADALQELGGQFQSEMHHEVSFSFGASSDLARQIKMQAPADVFVSADMAQMNGLIKANRVATDDCYQLLSNQLVVVEPVSALPRVKSAADLGSVQRIAIADPEAVPAGVYAKQWLESEGLWGTIAPKVVPTLDVRAALAAAETDSVGAAVVYRTDAVRSRRVQVSLEVPQGRAPRIVYPVAKLKGSRNPEAVAFVQFLLAPAAREVFARYGFATHTAGARCHN